jgi:hypothetical protein
MGVVGNTGSGKSCSVARIIQEALADLGDVGEHQKRNLSFLDINGEYARAFQIEQVETKEPNAVSINGQRFYLPLWAFNLTELVAFFEASQASQVPVLERVITEIRENNIDEAPGRALRRIVRLVDTCDGYIDTVLLYMENPTNPYCGDKLKKITDHLNSALQRMRRQAPYQGYVWPTSVSTMEAVLYQLKSVTDLHNIPRDVIAALTPIFEETRRGLNTVRSVAVTTED